MATVAIRHFGGQIATCKRTSEQGFENNASKDKSHPDYQPSLLLGHGQQMGPPTPSLNLSRHMRLAQRKKRARDSDAAETLLQLSKRPCITADNDCADINSLTADEVSPRADDDSTSADNDARVSQLQEEITTVRWEKSKLEREKKELEQKTQELWSRVAQLEAEKSLVAIANSQLVIQNHQCLSISL